MHPHVHFSIIHYSLDVETSYLSTDEWMDREDGIYLSIDKHTHTYIYTVIKMNVSLPFETTQLDLEGIILSEINQTDSI